MAVQFRTGPQLRQPTDYINALNLVANVAERVPIPDAHAQETDFITNRKDL